jgi:hypothetical protein
MVKPAYMLRLKRLNTAGELVELPARLLTTTEYIPACALVRLVNRRVLLVAAGTLLPLKNHW